MSQLMKIKIMNEKQPIKIKATSNFPTVNVGGTTDHSKLKNLDYVNSGHIGFASSEDIPTKVSELENDKGYIDNSVSNLVNYELKGKTGTNLGVSIDNTTYVMTIDLKNTAGDVISTGSVDLPLESMVVSATYDSDTKEIVLTLQSGETTRFSVADLVSGLVSQTDFDTAMTNIDEAFDTKFDLPYYFEYDSSTADYEDTTETTLALFNQLREEMEAGKKPCIIIRKGAVGANAYQTYHFVIPQFGTLDTAYIILKGSPIRSDGNVFNVVALNCERDPETGVITKVYEKKDEGSFEIGGGETDYYFEYQNERGYTDTSEETCNLFTEIWNKIDLGEHPKVMICKKNSGDYKLTAVLTPYVGSFGYLYFESGLIYSTANANRPYWQEIKLTVKRNSTTKKVTQVYESYYDSTTRGMYLMSAYEMKDKVPFISTDIFALTTENTREYTPTSDYNPATKKYVDDNTIHYIWDRSTGESAIALFQKVYDEYKTNHKILNVDVYRGDTCLKLVGIGNPRLLSDSVICQFVSLATPVSSGNSVELYCVNAVLSLTDNTVTAISLEETYGSYKLIREFNGTYGALSTTNTKQYTPKTPYNPATKHYVDEEHYKSITNYDGDKKQMLVHEGGVFVWEDIVS